MADRLDSTEAPLDRCRIVLAVPPLGDAADAVRQALSGGDVASLIVARGELDAAAYQHHAQAMVEASKDHGAAVLVEADSQVMGRSNADGMMIGGDAKTLAEATARFSPKKIVGYGPVKSRHQAMEAAEAGPDFLFIGKLDGDIRPEPHPKNLGLGEWCASVMQIPVLVMAGSAPQSALDVARTGADFAVLGLAVFACVDGPAEAVRKINEELDRHAPRFADEG
ncbi:MAG: thiamine phosphate synthase [Nitratireductor sp.]|nr:thiamine phosphate synthase [Nitratireductor sp.]